MTKQEILAELISMAARMEIIEGECVVFTGYPKGAAELALIAIHHTIDLVNMSRDIKCERRQA